MFWKFRSKDFDSYSTKTIFSINSVIESNSVITYRLYWGQAFDSRGTRWPVMCRSSPKWQTIAKMRWIWSNRISLLKRIYSSDKGVLEESMAEMVDEESDGRLECWLLFDCRSTAVSQVSAKDALTKTFLYSCALCSIWESFEWVSDQLLFYSERRHSSQQTNQTPKHMWRIATFPLSRSHITSHHLSCI